MRILSSLLCTLLAVAASGCQSLSPQLDSQFGQAVTLMQRQQVINPQAASNTNPVLGLDGRAARSGYAQYQKSFAAPEPQPQAFTIGIGGSAAK